MDYDECSASVVPSLCGKCQSSSNGANGCGNHFLSFLIFQLIADGQTCFIGLCTACNHRLCQENYNNDNTKRYCFPGNNSGQECGGCTSNADCTSWGLGTTCSGGLCNECSSNTDCDDPDYSKCTGGSRFPTSFSYFWK